MKTYDETVLRRFLGHVLDPAAGCMEFVAFHATFSRADIVPSTRFQSTVTGWFDCPNHLIVSAAHLAGVSGYVTLNPVSRDLMARASNKVRVSKDRTSDADVAVVRWLYVDIDSRRPDGISASQPELDAAIGARDRILEDHADLRASALWGCSGNGAWILARLPDLPNDPETYDAIRQALASLADRYGSKARGDVVHVDLKTCNAARVMCLPGTLKCKGENHPERPWRFVTLDTPEDVPPPPPFDLRAWLAAHPAPAIAPANGKRAHAPTDARPLDLDSSARQARAVAYLAKVPLAISGQGGHDQTFAAASALINGFDLTIEQARPLLQAYNAGCVPPWSDAELEHKLEDADRSPRREPRGYLLARPAPNGNGNGHANGEGRAIVAAMLAGELAHAPADLGEECPAGQEANPHRLARLFLARRHAHADGPTLRFWRDEFHAWDGRFYRPVPSKEVRGAVAQVVAAEFERLYLLALMRHRMRQAAQAAAKAGGSPQDGPGTTDAARPPGSRPGVIDAKEPRLLPVTSSLITDVIQALSGLVLLPVSEYPEAPAWLDGDEAGQPGGWGATDVLPTAGGLIHLPSLVAGRPHNRTATPRFLTTWSCDYGPPAGPDRGEASAWLEFLASVWPDDPESLGTIQEWFGYCLTPDTRQQKALAMIGPKRSGKGTIARVLRALIGSENCAGPTLSGLATNFGLAPLIGKPLAIIDDARLSGRSDLAVIVERILTITGEGTLTIDRKHMEAWTGKLPTRMVLLSNELPKLTDASGALASRLILLRMTRSFYGQEDKTLFDRLVGELPEILLWAIEGWKRLQARGEFQQPDSAADLVEDMVEIASPVIAWGQESCDFGPGKMATVGDLYNSWKAWCQAQGREHAGDHASFGRRLTAAFPAIRRARPGPHRGPRVRAYEGIQLRSFESCARTYADAEWRADDGTPF